MNKLKSLPIATIVILLSSAAWAATDSESQTPSDMPMMNKEQNSMMMKPEMMAAGQHQHMPMMNPHMMHMRMHGMSEMDHGHAHAHGHGQNRDMPMVNGGKEGMMNPQMMQTRMQHMNKMEQLLENIESLLSQLVELQKAE